MGPDFPLMLDCYMALSVPYAIKLGRALAPHGLKWMEEFLPPDDYDGYVEVKKALAGVVLTTTGEHEYSRYGFRKLIADKAVDVLQPDITWLGGMTEARRIVAMAAAYDIPVIPHGSSIYSYHLQYAFHNCPIAESARRPPRTIQPPRTASARAHACRAPPSAVINLSPNADKIVPYFGGLFPDEPLPANGFIDLPDRPGFGVTLDRSGLSRPYPRTEAQSLAQATANKARPAPATAMCKL